MAKVKAGKTTLCANVHDHPVRAERQPLPNSNTRTRVHRLVGRRVSGHDDHRCQDSWVLYHRSATTGAIQKSETGEIREAHSATRCDESFDHARVYCFPAFW